MRLYTGHTKGRAEPILVPEAFSVSAFIFGPIWFAAKRAWVPAAGFLLLWVLLVAFAPAAIRGPLELLAAVAAGLFGQDLRRQALHWRGYQLTHVIAARNEDVAFARLLDERPDLRGAMA